MTCGQEPGSVTVLYEGMARKPSYLDFDKSNYPWKPDADYRAHPERYRVGRGEQGVLICQPYKDELVPLWRLKSVDEAQKSSLAIWQKFQEYMAQDDFVGADMARKFLQMGFTRARRYANYKGGRKYAGADHHELQRGTGDPEKAKSASIFYELWKQAEADTAYAAAKKAWKAKYG
jgi:hypothetical protein